FYLKQGLRGTAGVQHGIDLTALLDAAAKSLRLAHALPSPFAADVDRIQLPLKEQPPAVRTKRGGWSRPATAPSVSLPVAAPPVSPQHERAFGFVNWNREAAESVREPKSQWLLDDDDVVAVRRSLRRATALGWCAPATWQSAAP